MYASFEGPEGKKYIPIETTDSLYIYSNVIFSGNFFEFVNDRALNVSLINKYGEKIGSFVSQNSRRNIKTELKQLKLYEDEAARLDLARKLKLPEYRICGQICVIIIDVRENCIEGSH